MDRDDVRPVGSATPGRDHGDDHQQDHGDRPERTDAESEAEVDHQSDSIGSRSTLPISMRAASVTDPCIDG